MPSPWRPHETATGGLAGWTGQHLAGIDVKVDHERGTDSQCPLQDKRDFHWQRLYTHAAPVAQLSMLEPGDKITRLVIAQLLVKAL